MGRCKYLVAVAATFQLAAGAAAAGPCDGVVEDTLAELRAGSGKPWSEEEEALARAAAGSACVKASSGRYVAPEPLSTDPVAASGDADIAPGDAADVEEHETEAAPESDDGSWSLGGLTVRSLSGSPAKKPYQRQREQNKDD